MGLFHKTKEPVFLRESNGMQEQLENLKELEPLLNDEGKTLLQQEIRQLEYGLIGEKKIEFELKNSHMPMCILHDVYLEAGEPSAQIDYLVFTRKICFIIECKNLYGNIEINNAGNFIRTLEFNGKKKKEGIYSPITQNQRHLELMKKIKVDSAGNFLKRFLKQSFFNDFYVPLVVLTNPKTVLYDRYAKKEIKGKVIRVDQLVARIKEIYDKSKESASSEKKMFEWAESYLNLHKEVKKDYLEKFEQYRLPLHNQVENPVKELKEKGKNSPSLRESQVFEELKMYRLNKSREENIKAYFVFNNNELESLIAAMPRNKEELLKITGFGKIKVEKYGADILEILNKYLK